MNTPPAISWTTLLAVFSLALPLCAAERDRAARGERPPARRHPPEPRADAPPGPGFDRFLNEAQRERLREAVSDQRETMRKLDARSAELRRDIEESLLAEKLDEKALRKKSAELAEIQTERQLLRARAFARIRESLTPEQIERIRERMRHRMQQRFDGRRMDLPPRPFGPRFGEQFRRPQGIEPRREEARRPDGGPDRRQYRPRGPVPPRPPASDDRPPRREFRGPPGGEHGPAPLPPPDYRRPREPMPPPAPRVDPRRREGARDGREAREREDTREPRDRREERGRERDDRDERHPRPPGEPD
jgi:Spy/CpxP family protein refolding chaperone